VGHDFRPSEDVRFPRGSWRDADLDPRLRISISFSQACEFVMDIRPISVAIGVILQCAPAAIAQSPAPKQNAPNEAEVIKLPKNAGLLP